MATRQVRTEQDRNLLITLIQNQGFPFTASVTKGVKRSTDQNRLQRMWINEISEQLPDQSAEEWRGFCKLHFGVPIMRNASEEFQETYDEIIRPLPYEMKVRLMMIPIDLPVTRDMKTSEKHQYLSDIYTHFTGEGVEFTEPMREGAA